MGKKFSKDGSKFVTDEVFNSASHLMGAIFSLVGVVLLIALSSTAGKPWHIVSFSIYGISLLFVFFASSLHHGINASKKTEALLRLIDYIAIFPLIAGTFTPLCLILLRNVFGWSIFGVIWTLALSGLMTKLLFPKIPKWVTNTIYICMGWMGAIIAFPLFKFIGYLGLILLAAGGIFFSIGFIIFSLEKPNLMPGKFGYHEIWHIFVLLGALSHYLMMYFTVLPH